MVEGLTTAIPPNISMQPTEAAADLDQEANMDDEQDYDFEETVEFSPEHAPHGHCPACGTALQNWGAASHGDGDIFDEIGCPLCEEVIDEAHASYCQCLDCNPYGEVIDDDSEARP